MYEQTKVQFTVRYGTLEGLFPFQYLAENNFCFNFCSVFIVLISFLLNIEKEMFNICFDFRSVVIVLIPFLLNIGKEMSLPGFRSPLSEL